MKWRFEENKFCKTKRTEKVIDKKSIKGVRRAREQKRVVNVEIKYSILIEYYFWVSYKRNFLLKCKKEKPILNIDGVYCVFWASLSFSLWLFLLLFAFAFCSWINEPRGEKEKEKEREREREKVENRNQLLIVPLCALIFISSGVTNTT